MVNVTDFTEEQLKELAFTDEEKKELVTPILPQPQAFYPIFTPQKR